MDLDYPSGSDLISVDPKTVRQFQEITNVQEQSKDVTIEIEELGKKRIGYEKMFLSVVVMVVACLIIHFIFIFISIRMQFGDLIDYIDKDVVAKAKTASNPSDYYTYTDGYSIAFYYKFPGLPTNPFLNTAFPASIVFSYYTQHFSGTFLRDQTLVQQMYIYSVIGSLNQCGNGQDPTIQPIQQTCSVEPGAHQIICATYGTAFVDCKHVCRKDISLGTYSMVGQLIAMGGMGAFVGGATGRGTAEGIEKYGGYAEGPGKMESQIVGASLMATVGVTMAVVTTQMSKSEDAEYQEDISAGYCEQPGT